MMLTILDKLIKVLLNIRTIIINKKIGIDKLSGYEEWLNSEQAALLAKAYKEE